MMLPPGFKQLGDSLLVRIKDKIERRRLESHSELKAQSIRRAIRPTNAPLGSSVDVGSEADAL
jgi:hypothetical protein